MHAECEATGHSVPELLSDNRGEFHNAEVHKTLRERGIHHTNKLSSKQPKSYLLLTFRPLSEAFIRRSWY